MTPSLIIFAGLPATGKTTLARLLASRLGATYLRIDTIEQALRESGALAGPMDDVGYRVGYALAADNLLGDRNPVVVDTANSTVQEALARLESAIPHRQDRPVGAG